MMIELLKNPLFLIFASITVTSVVSTVAYYWHKVRKLELEASLKQSMIERNMSAEEIKTVLEATSGRKAGRESAAPESLV